MRMGYQALTALCLGWTATVWSTVLSYRDNPAFNFDLAFQFDPSNPLSVMGYGGFPWRVFAYPAPPLGPGPFQSPLPLLLTVAFWFTVVFLVLRLSGQTKQQAPPLFGLAIWLTLASTVFWFGYILLKFD